MSDHVFPTFRSEMTGKRVVKAQLDAEGVGVSLEGGWSISIWNVADYFVAGASVSLSKVSMLEGTFLLQFVGNETEERLVFSNDTELIVHLDAKSSTGPESMAVHGPNHCIVVWNS